MTEQRFYQLPFCSPFSRHGLSSVCSLTVILTVLQLEYDETGEGWKRHMMYGVARLFDLYGPEVCQAAELRGLYRDVRLFEISGAALLTQTTFLIQADWRDMHTNLRTGIVSSELEEDVFDLLLRCTDLCQRFVLSFSVRSSIWTDDRSE